MEHQSPTYYQTNHHTNNSEVIYNSMFDLFSKAPTINEVANKQNTGVIINVNNVFISNMVYS